MPRRQLLISIFLVAVLGLHALANLGKAALGPFTLAGDRSWPFLAYGMYRYSHPPGPIRASKQEVVALSASGDELVIVPEVVGLRPQALRQHFINPMRGGDSQAASRLADRMNVGREDPIVAFRVERDSYVMTDAGVLLEDSESETYRVER